MKLTTFVKIISAVVLPFVLSGCLIARRISDTPATNGDTQTPTNTSWEAQEVGGIESNTTYHFRYSIPATISEKSSTVSTTIYEKDGRDVLTVTALAGTKEQVKRTVTNDFSSTSSVTTATDKPWDVYTTGSLQNQVLAFADGTSGVIMAFTDVPSNIVKGIQESFAFTLPSSKLTSFTNTKHKYTVSYPINYQLFATNDDRSEPAVSNVVHLSILPNYGDITIEVHEYVPGETFASFLKNVHGIDSQSTGSFKVNGLTAYAYNGTMTTQRVGVINANGRAIIFTYEDGSRCDDIVQTFDTIMKSFKLL